MKIGLVPVSAKPYHAGHHYLIETAASKNDKVIVYASTSDRKRKGEFPVSGRVMQLVMHVSLVTAWILSLCIPMLLTPR